MKKLKFLSIFLTLCLAAALIPPSAPALALDAPSIASRAAVVMDRGSGEVFFAKNEDERVYPASTTKIMTVLLAVEAIERGAVSASDEVTAAAGFDYDLAEDANAVNISAGETMTLLDYLYCAMVASANDACNVVAEYIGGDIPAFINMMNARAAELGCEHTHFANTHGMPDEDHYTTASDFCRIAMEAVTHDLFMQLADTPSITIPATDAWPAARQLTNSNALITADSPYGSVYLYPDAHGVKTGYTEAAGYCLVSTASRDGIDLLAAVFGGERYALDEDTDGYTSFSDSITLYDWVFRNYSYQEVLDPNASIASVDVLLGRDTDYVNLRPAGSVSLLLPVDYDPDEIQYDKRVYSVEQGEYVTAPVTAGQVLGEVSVLRNGENCGTVKLVAASSVDLSRGQYITSHLRETTKTPAFFWLCFAVVLILGAYLAWVIVYRARRRRYVNSLMGLASAREREQVKAAVLAGGKEPEIEFFGGEEEAAALPEAVAGAEDGDGIPLGDTTPIPDLTELEAELSSAAGEIAEPLLEEDEEDMGDDEDAPKPPPEDPSIYKDAGRDYFEEFFRRK